MNKKIVMLAEKAGNGKIVKNEQYSIEEFLNKVIEIIHPIAPKSPTYFDKLFKTQKWDEWDNYLSELQIFAIEKNIRERIHANIICAIEQDIKGKKNAK